ncbi:MAG: dicarboxylate/amino acid:cation symporter [Cytophagales bacterium]
MSKFKIGLTAQIFIGMALGIVAGHFLPEYSVNLKLLSDIFLRLIKMIIAPLVFSTLVVGIAKLGDFKTVGRIGIKTLGYFYFATIISLTLGLIIVNIFKPGLMMHLTLPTTGTETGVSTSTGTFGDFLSRMFPISFVDSMAKNDILPILVFSIFFGIGLASIGEKGRPITKALDALADVMFKITGYVMYFAPIGVFGALAANISKQGIGILSGYFYLIVCYYGGLLFFCFVILALICYVMKINFIALFKAIKEPSLIAFSTATSESAFPKLVLALEKFGCPPKIVGFVLPLGYSFNLDGSMMNMTFSTMFIAQAYGMNISIEQQISMMLILLLASKGVAGVPRASLVVVASMLTTFNIPGEGLLLLLGIDQILDMGRSATNVVGNAVATCVVSKWEKEQ